MFEVRIAASAVREIRKTSRWWRTQRLSAPNLFDEELEAIIEMLEVHPSIGAVKQFATVGNVRAVVLRRTRYLVAYQLREADQEVWVLRVRHAGRRPLRAR